MQHLVSDLGLQQKSWQIPLPITLLQVLAAYLVCPLVPCFVVHLEYQTIEFRLGINLPKGIYLSLSYLTFKVLWRILSLCSFSFITGSLHLFRNDSLYSILVEMRCSPSSDRLASSSALYKSCKESPNFSSWFLPERQGGSRVKNGEKGGKETDMQFNKVIL